MWLFSQKGFFSIVEHKDDPDLLLVRSRVKGDIEKYWPTAIVKENAGSDYRFRAFLPRFEVVDKVAKMVHDINYPDYKESVADMERIPWYVDVWSTMSSMQHHLKRTERVES